MKTAVAIAALLLSQGAMAQMFKCTDKAGKTTYSSQPCRELGLQDGGEIKDRLQVTPAPVYQSSPPPSRTVREEPVQKPAAAAEEPAKQPERRCFTIATKGGKKVTRCNDKPDEDAQ